MRKLIFIGVFLLCLFGCDKPNFSTPEFYVGRENFSAIILANGLESPNGTLIQHSKYSLVSRDWVINDFSKSFEQFQTKNNLWLLKRGVFDCGDFSDYCRLWAKTYWVSQDHKYAAAAGKFIYHPDTPGPAHAICVFVLGTSITNASVLFYEPQTRREVFLSQKERTNFFWVEF